jgi:hypothetical protein
LESIARWLKISHGTVLLHRRKLQFLVGSLGNHSSGHVFLALDTGHTIIRHQWVALPMPPTVINCINLLGQRKPAMLTFTDRHGQDIGDNNPQDANTVGILDDIILSFILPWKSQEWI